MQMLITIKSLSIRFVSTGSGENILNTRRPVLTLCVYGNVKRIMRKMKIFGIFLTIRPVCQLFMHKVKTSELVMIIFLQLSAETWRILTTFNVDNTAQESLRIATVAKVRLVMHVSVF